MNQQSPIYLALKWSVSRGRDTYGYNIVTLTTPDGTKHRCNGGGYDMQGTVFAQWLASNYKERLAPIARRVHESKERLFYGMTARVDGSFYLDGAAGLESMLSIAKAIGLEVTQARGGRKYELQGFMIVDTAA